MDNKNKIDLKKSKRPETSENTHTDEYKQQRPIQSTQSTQSTTQPSCAVQL